MAIGVVGEPIQIGRDSVVSSYDQVSGSGNGVYWQSQTDYQQTTLLAYDDTGSPIFDSPIVFDTIRSPIVHVLSSGKAIAAYEDRSGEYLVWMVSPDGSKSLTPITFVAQRFLELSDGTLAAIRQFTELGAPPYESTLRYYHFDAAANLLETPLDLVKYNTPGIQILSVFEPTPGSAVVTTSTPYPWQGGTTIFDTDGADAGSFRRWTSDNTLFNDSKGFFWGVKSKGYQQGMVLQCHDYLGQKIGSELDFELNSLPLSIHHTPDGRAVMLFSDNKIVVINAERTAATNPFDLSGVEGHFRSVVLSEDAAGHLVLLAEIETVERKWLQRKFDLTSFTGTEDSDRWFGGNATDTVNTNGGNDNVWGGGGDDVIDGGDGDDVVHGGLGADQLTGGAGLDTVSYSDAATELIFSFADLGSASGAPSEDTLIGFENVIGSATMKNSLTGNWQANNLVGGAADDLLLGLDGSDTLTPGAGVDQIDGGKGSDTVNYGLSMRGVSIDLSKAIVKGRGAAAGDTLVSIENVIGSTTASNTIRGNRKDNDISGSAKRDKLYGGAGDDVFRPGKGRDVLDGGTGIDTVDYSDVLTSKNEDQISVNLTGIAEYEVPIFFSVENAIGSSGDDSLNGGAASNLLKGNDGDDFITGEAGNDVLHGGNGNDVIDGDKDPHSSIKYVGRDRISGGSGNDQIYGNAGKDRIRGDDGDDIIGGGSGADLLRGGTGADTFVFSFPTDGPDKIADFDRKDVLSFASHEFGFKLQNKSLGEKYFYAASTNKATKSDHRFIYETDSHRLWFDEDGSGGAGPVLIATMQNGYNLTADDIFLSNLLYPT